MDSEVQTQGVSWDDLSGTFWREKDPFSGGALAPAINTKWHVALFVQKQSQNNWGWVRMIRYDKSDPVRVRSNLEWLSYDWIWLRMSQKHESEKWLRMT